MKIQLELFAQLRVAAGRTSVQVECEQGATLDDVLGLCASGLGTQAMDLLLDGSGALRPTILASIDGRQARGQQRLHDGDTVVLGTPISGG